MVSFPIVSDRSFFERDDVVQVAQDLLGHVLARRHADSVMRLVITETEAYRGYGDKASHAANGRRTARTEVFFKAGGHAYVYLCYGMHWLFNIITNREGHPDAVLIRGGILLGESPKVITGPGRITRTLFIDGQQNGVDLLQSNELWLERACVGQLTIQRTPRIGVAYAGEDALLPWRFVASGQEVWDRLMDLKSAHPNPVFK
ncbi:MAG: DNA-3-methyladenine glycosylase [Flavobacteriales bacterium]|nr:DNA-3-methyladenine glycosylase [Flavobacteriales bacterium]MCX7768600.1 DNA-3-methyladenine glycosylase [Flavobacteriales bacterium]MDW8409746.1 DNA-3-methyladenine glycosylase [Flavobacteriales bacterium]